MRRQVIIRSRFTFLLVFLVPVLGYAQEETPWRLQSASGAPDWLSITGSYRLRYEHMENTFRVVGPAQDEILVSRLRLHARASGERFYGGFELEDARAWLHGDLTPVGTDDVNALEPLRAYIGYRNDEFDIQVGRMTMNVGSRRFVARNVTRNTTNGFTGINAVWKNPDRFALQAFFTMPVARLPNNLERSRLRDNEFDLDQEHWERIFWGLHTSGVRIGKGLDTEWYLLGIREEDRPSLPTRNRDFLTLGTRWRKVTEAWSFEFEAAVQHGKTRASILPSDVTDLDHRAWFTHVEYGRKLAGRWQPSLILRFDYASGDEDPDDGEFNSFDTLFGARRWEFGVTGIYGALARSNILSPGVALRLKPRPSIDLGIDYRPAWLASDRDFLITAILRDRDGNSGSFIGHQLELRWRWRPQASMVSVDVSAAYLWKGEFLKNAPLAPPPHNTFFWYLATNLAF
jgi:hypothetical protein